MIKGSVQQEDITIINTYAPNTRVPTYVKQILTELKGEIECHAFTLGDFNTPLTPKERSITQGDRGSEKHIRTDAPNTHLQNIPSNSSRIHILLKCTWNIFKNRSYSRPQKDPQ